MYLPDYYEFGCPTKIMAGHDALEKIPEILASKKASRPLVLTDKGVAAAGLADIVVNAVSHALNVGPVEDDVPQDSEIETVNRIARMYRDEGCDSIIAVGGGSVLDTAKGVNIVASENGDDVRDYAGMGALKRRLNPLIAVPTTSGTGSETTVAALIADAANNRKLLYASPFLLPDAAVLDSRMTLTLPPFLTAMTGMDALSHAVEAYTGLATKPVVNACCRQAVRLIGKHLLHVTRNPDDREGRLALAVASTLAGIAVSTSKISMVHMLGHATGGVCHTPHGTCMAILLPYGIEYNQHQTGHLYADLLEDLIGKEACREVPARERAQRFAREIRCLNQELHTATACRHPRFLKETGSIKEADLPKIAKTALSDPGMIANREALDYNDCLMVLEAAWQGTSLDKSRVRTTRPGPILPYIRRWLPENGDFGKRA